MSDQNIKPILFRLYLENINFIYAMKNEITEKSSSTSALIARINRKLAHQDQKLHKTRPCIGYNQLGDYYILDYNRNFIVASNVDVVKLAHELKLTKASDVK